MNGTISIMPKKPYMIDGMPASSFTHWLSSGYMRLGQNRAMNIAAISPTGTPSISAPPDTYRLPTII